MLTHTEPVFGVGFYRDGRGILTTSADGLVRLWDRTTGRSLDYPLRHVNTVASAALSPDGRALLTGGGEWYVLRRSEDLMSESQNLDGFACVWDLATATLLAGPLVHPEIVTGVAFRGDGKTFATGCQDGHVRIWTRLASRSSRSYELKGKIRRLAFSRDGRYLVVGSENEITGSVSVLENSSGKWRHLATRPDVQGRPPSRAAQARPMGSSPSPATTDRENRARSIHCVVCSPTARWPSRPVRTASPGCGTSRSAASMARRCRSGARSIPGRPSARTGGPSSRVAKTGRFASGRRPPAGRSSPR